MFTSNEHGIKKQAQVVFSRSGWRQYIRLNRTLLYCGERCDVPAERVRAGLCNGRLICLSLLPNSRMAGRCAGIPSYYIGGSGHDHLYPQG